MKRKEKNLLLIFTRNPELGKVKTRLAKTIGNQKALAIYKFLLEKTCKVATQVKADKAVYYSVQIRENDIWDPSIFKKYLQKGADLGLRMEHAFQNGFKKGYEKIVIIGSDLYDLSSDTINQALTILNQNDIVIGPAEDGGYYLLGMKKMHSSIFKNKEWGTSSVRKDTLENIKHKKVKFLATKNDIDIYEDILNIPEIMSTFINPK